MLAIHPYLLEERDLPCQFDRFRIVGILGEGGMARVFDAQMEGRLDFRKPVALKILHPDPGVDAEQMMARLASEARLGALLSHPNIVDTYDYGVFDGHAWIALERISGLTLARVLEYERPLPVGVALEIGRQVSRAMAHAHELELDGAPYPVVHRDLKPGNVFLTVDAVVKVVDFGIATTMTRAHGKLTEPGIAKGTPAYMSPEQAEARATTPASDVFALGLMLYELLTGRVLMGSESPMGSLWKLAQLHETLDKEHLGSRLDALHPGLASLVQHCLLREPRERASAIEVADRIDELADTVRDPVSFNQWSRRLLARGGLLRDPRPSERTQALGPTRKVGGPKELRQGFQAAEAVADLATTEGIEAAARTTVELAHQWLEVDNVALYLMGPTGDLALRAALGVPEGAAMPTSLAQEPGPVAVALESPAVARLGEPDQPAALRALARAGFAELLPLIHSTRPIGILALTDTGTLDPSTALAAGRALASGIAAVQARVAAETAGREARRSLHHLGLLLPVPALLAAARERSEQLLAALGDVVAEVRAIRGSLFLVDPQAQFLKIRMVSGLAADVAAEINDGEAGARSFRRGEGVAGRAWSEGRPIRLERPLHDPRFEGDAPSRMISLICVPVAGQSGIVGVLNLSNRKDGGAFSAEDEATIVASAARIADILAGTGAPSSEAAARP